MFGKCHECFSRFSQIRALQTVIYRQGHRKFDLFAERDEKVHGKNRSLVSRAYTMTSLTDLEPYVDDTIKVFLDKMAEAKGRVDLGKWVQLYAFGECLHRLSALETVIHNYLSDSY